MKRLILTTNLKALFTRVTGLLSLIALCCSFGIATASAATISISNIAELSYQTPGGTVRVPSNRVEDFRQRAPATIDFLMYRPQSTQAQSLKVQPTAFDSSGSETWQTLAAPKSSQGGALNLAASLSLVQDPQFRQGEPLFIRLSDLDANRDPAVLDTVIVTLTTSSGNDSETLLLTETSPNSGVFLGYVPTQASGGGNLDGALTVERNSRIIAQYTDAGDLTDNTESFTLVDPYGLVLDSCTGELIDGVSVTLINAASGLPAAVFGDDGVSRYPSTVVTGEQVIDAGGTVYPGVTGRYRFPLIETGRYALRLDPPDGYVYPSRRTNAETQASTPFPVVLVNGSRGEVFTIVEGPPLYLDLPVDCVAIDPLFVNMSTDQAKASIGDFVAFTIDVGNTNSDTDYSDVVVNDRLPLGFIYRSGSATLDGRPIADPQIASNGRDLVFNLDLLEAGETRSIDYVIEVGPGTPIATAISISRAQASGGEQSNSASAGVNVRDPFFRNQGILIGTVSETECKDDEDEQPWRGIAGIRFYLEDGTNVQSDDKGMFHFEGVRPGLHVVQLDVDTIPAGYEVVNCEPDNRFAGRAYSQFVDLRGGSLWRLDYHLIKTPAPVADVELNLGVTLVGEQLQYSIDNRGGAVALSNRSLIVTLPPGSLYESGSARLNTEVLADPQQQGNRLTFNLGGVETSWRDLVTFSASLPEQADELTSKALLKFDTPSARGVRTPAARVTLMAPAEPASIMHELTYRAGFTSLGADLSAADHASLAQRFEGLDVDSLSRIQVIGHTDNQPISGAARRRYSNNEALSLARARTVGRHIRDILGLLPDQVSVAGHGAREPLTENNSAEGRRENRRVEVRILQKTTPVRSVSLAQEVESGWRARLVKGIAKADQVERSVTSTKVTLPGMPAFDQTWLNSVPAGNEWLWPLGDYSPEIPSIKIALKHGNKLRARLMLDGVAVSALNFDGTIKSSDGKKVVSRWNGVDVREGDNHFVAELFDRSGKVAERVEKVIHYSSAPVKGRLLSERSRLEADGKSALIVAVQFYDAAGFPARAGVVGQYLVDSGHRPRAETDDLTLDPLANTGSDYQRFTVEDAGIAYIELEPTTQSGEVVLRFKLENNTQEVRAWTQASQREWILVGVAEGTIGLDRLTGNRDNANDAGKGKDDDLLTDTGVAFFAKGRVKGDWLLTMSYDSNREGTMANNDLFKVIDPDQYYTLYGDESEQRYDAASREKLYVKLERKQFYAMYGDYETGLNVTDLARYNRSLTGFKSELQTERFDLNVFASQASEGFVKDEIRGDGTTGPYSLSRSVLINTDKISIETRDRFRNEKVLERRQLRSHTDYEIDYDRGVIYFKAPVASSDFDFNPKVIVIDYETEGTGEEALNYGGRVAVKLLDGALEIGASSIHENNAGDEGDLQGLDLRYDITDKTQLRAEIATSESVEEGVRKEGQARSVEITHRDDDLDVRGYYRELEEDFGLGQQSASGRGVRKLGVDASYRLNDRNRITGRKYRETRTETDAQRDVSEARYDYRGDNYSIYVGARQTDDLIIDYAGTQQRQSSKQALVGGETRMMDGRLRLRASHEQNIGDEVQSTDFPNRTKLGADYKLTDKVDLYAEQEYTKGDTRETEKTRVGVRTYPWEGGEIDTSLGQQLSEESARLFATAGLRQRWQLSDRWSTDFSIDRSQTLESDSPVRVDPDSEEPDAEIDYTSVSVGNAYHADDWTLSSRVEVRDGETEQRWGAAVGVVAEVEKGTAVAAKARYGDSRRDDQRKRTLDLSLGLAYRPRGGKLTVLDRLDYQRNDETIGSVDRDDWSLTNNLNLNYKPNDDTQLALHHGIKYQQKTIAKKSYKGYTDTLGAEVRHDFGDRFDVGAHASILRNDSGQSETSFGVSVGVNPMRNTWISVGYNFEGYDNNDFSGGNFTSKGAFVRFAVKFDQDSVRELLGND
uniref:OmpA family protein n=1 Tax=Marinobacterium profundum TaxID=1714300 RepID=UPI0008305387|nr:OmpA family protein [Marinobacterium profundum]